MEKRDREIFILVGEEWLGISQRWFQANPVRQHEILFFG